MYVYYSAIKKIVLPYETTWMNLESSKLTQIRQTEKDKHSVFTIH